MNFDQLNTFCVVAEEESFSRAGKYLHLSPSAVLRKIRSLETELGVELFEADRRGTTATPAGTALAQSAARIIESIEQLKALATTFAVGHQGSVRIACHDPYATRLRVALCDYFTQYFPDIDVSLTRPPDGDAIRQFDASDLLAHRDLDLVITAATNDDLSGTEMWRSKCVVVLHRDHPLRDERSVTVDQLIGEQVLVLPRPALTRRHFDAAALEVGRSFDLRETTDRDLLVARARAGRGVGIIGSDYVAETAARPFPALLGVEAKMMSVVIRMAWLQGRPMAPPAHTLVQFVRARRHLIDNALRAVLAS